jgi:hypothetical protein
MTPTEVAKCIHKFGEGPGKQGCWYCDGTDGIQVGGVLDPSIHFSDEFDCWIHLCCILKAHEDDPGDGEAAIFYDEFFTNG